MYGIKANNVKERKFRPNASLTLLEVKDDRRALCKGISTGGRVIIKWANLNNLGNFRAAFIHNKDHNFTLYDSKEEAEDTIKWFQQHLQS